MDKLEIEGGQIVNWLNQTDQKTVSEILIGCSFDDGEADELLEVVEINISSRVMVCRIGNATQRIPCRAERGNAWWLLCQLSP